MKSIIQFKTITSPLVIITVALLCLAAAGPRVQAVTPPPDGGDPGGNTAEGQNALFSRTTGGFNTALGWSSLKSLTTGSFNTGVGAGTLVLNTGDENTATGVGALLLNTTGGSNTANGALALFNNTTGGFNTANGDSALQSNTTGGENTANGAGALNQNTTGSQNTANGYNALASNVVGGRNTANGFAALALNTTGSNNIALGAVAGQNVTTGDYNIDIGNIGAAGDANTIRIGDDNQGSTFIAGIYGVSVAGLAVAMDSSGRLGTVGSSRRFKKEIKPMDKASEAILALKPVTFRYKKEIDPAGTSQFGLLAEDVEKVNPDLVVRDNDGEIYTVRYDAVNAMLLNEFLNEHRRVQKQTQKIQEQETTIAELKKQVQIVVTHAKEQDIKIQRVSDQIQINSSPVVVTDR
jgi:Chaperone of endosialidase